MKRLRVGVVGAGFISSVYAKTFAAVPEGELVGVCSRTQTSAQRFADRFGLPHATDSLDALLPQVDVVCVNSPNALHDEHAIAAARAGKHVIVEKPLAVSLEAGEAIVHACEAAGVGLAYAEELPFVPLFARARARIARGEIGEPTLVRVRYAHAGPHSPWFFSRDMAGGGVGMDMACHALECARWLLGKPSCAQVSARLSTLAHGDRTQLEDHAEIQLHFDGGVRATCEASWALSGGMQAWLEVWGRDGRLVADLLGERGLRVHRAGEGWTTEVQHGPVAYGYGEQLRSFLNSFREGTEPLESGRDGLAVLEMLYAAYASAREEKPVALPFRVRGVERAVDLWRPRS